MSPTSPEPAPGAGRADRRVQRAELVVVGAGPAGLAAALAAADAGVHVLVLDTYAAPGGQYHRSSAPGLDRAPPAWPRRRGRTSRAPRAGGRAPLLQRTDAAVAAGRIVLRSGVTVWTARHLDGAAPFELHLAATVGDLDGPTRVRADLLVLATGAIDRVLPFPGADLPGVVTAGGAQALLKGQGVRIGDRVVVGGSGPFLLPVAAALAEAGSDVVAVAEAQPASALARHAPIGWRHRTKLAEGAAYARALARHRVPVRPATAVVAAEGDGRVEQVTLARLEPDWRPRPGTSRTVAVDAAAVSFGFVPQVGLAARFGCRLAPDPVWADPAVVVDTAQATSVPGVFAAGETTGVTGVEGATAEGTLAGIAAAAALGHLDAADAEARSAAPRADRARHRAFAVALGRMYRRSDGWLAWLREDTLVCRCEEVDHATVRRAIHRDGATDLRSVKLVTRCGMGACQARGCNDALAAVVAQETGRPVPDLGALSAPPILAPVTLATLADLADDDHLPRHGSLGRDAPGRPATTEPS
jgi:NADPH-dependent 2,4-dienoyl-CoA reductase/sulfur reductase-like enzyme